jgi:hypothetical protein
MAYRLPLAEFDADDQLPPDFKRVENAPLFHVERLWLKSSSASFKFGRWQKSGEIAEI